MRIDEDSFGFSIFPDCTEQCVFEVRPYITTVDGETIHGEWRVVDYASNGFIYNAPEYVGGFEDNVAYAM